MKRTFDAKVRKVGNSYVVTIPIETIERFKFSEGDYVALTLDSEDTKKAKKEEKIS